MLRLQDVSPRRVRAYSLSFKSDKADPLGTGATPPYLSAPSSPKFLRMLDDGDSAVSENLLPSCRLEGAVPFKWEEKPGTPKSPQVTALVQRPWGAASPEADKDPPLLSADSPRKNSATKDLFGGGAGGGSLSPLPELAEARESAVEEQPDFEFSSSTRFEDRAGHGGGGGGGGHPAGDAADDHFFHAHFLPLKPPPRLQSQQLAASKHWRSATCDSLPVTEEDAEEEAGDVSSDSSSQSVAMPAAAAAAAPTAAASAGGTEDSSRSSSCTAQRSLGQAVGLTTISGRRSGSASAAKKFLAFCGLSNKGVRRNSTGGRDEARLSTSEVYLMSAQDNGGSSEARLSSAAKDPNNNDLFFTLPSSAQPEVVHSRRTSDRSRVRSVDFTGHSRRDDVNFASADCSLAAGGASGKASLPATPLHRKSSKSFSSSKDTRTSTGFLSGFRSGKEEDASRHPKKLFKDDDAADRDAAHRRVRSLSPLSVFRRGERTKRASVDDKDGISSLDNNHISWPFDEKEAHRDSVDARPYSAAGIPKKHLGNTSSKAWNGLRGLTLTELLEDPRDLVASTSSRHTDSPGSNSSSGSFGTGSGSGSFGSVTSSSNSGGNGCTSAGSGASSECVDSGPLPYYSQDVKPARLSNASASPGLKKALLAKGLVGGSNPPDATSTSEALTSDHFPLYRRYKSHSAHAKEDPLGRFKSFLPNKDGIFSCLGCSTVKSYDAFQGMPNVPVA